MRPARSHAPTHLGRQTRAPCDGDKCWSRSTEVKLGQVRIAFLDAVHSTPPTLMLVPLRESVADDRLPPEARSPDCSCSLAASGRRATHPPRTSSPTES